MKKLLLATVIGLFTINGFAADADAASDATKAPAKKVHTMKKHPRKHTAAPAKKADTKKDEAAPAAN